MWIARDRNKSLWLYIGDKPYKDLTNECWNNLGINRSIDPKLFPKVKWEDEEPTEVELVIKR